MLEYESTYNMFDNPIPRNGLFATKTIEEISQMIEQYPAKQKADLYLVMMFTLNACNKLVQDEVLDQMGNAW